MSGFVPYVFTPAQIVQILDLCGFPARGNGTVVFPAPWINKQYLAIEYRLQNLSVDEGNYLLTTYVQPLLQMQAQFTNATATLNIGVAGPYVRNPKEMRERRKAYDDWRRLLCRFFDVDPGPGITDTADGQMRCVV